MGALQIVIVVGTVEVGGHGGDEIAAVLAAEGLAKFETGNFGDGIPFVGRLQRAGEKVFLLDRLRGELGVDAGTAQKEQFGHAGPPRAFNEVVLNLEIFQKEFGGLTLVGENAADLGGGDKDVFRFLGGKEILDGGGIEQIELAPGFAEEVFETLALQFAP